MNNYTETSQASYLYDEEQMKMMMQVAMDRESIEVANPEELEALMDPDEE